MTNSLITLKECLIEIRSVIFPLNGDPLQRHASEYPSTVVYRNKTNKFELRSGHSQKFNGMSKPYTALSRVLSDIDRSISLLLFKRMKTSDRRIIITNTHVVIEIFRSGAISCIPITVNGMLGIKIFLIIGRAVMELNLQIM